MILIDSGNISNLINREVFDPTFVNDNAVGTISSAFLISGEFGLNVHYELDRLQLDESATSMSGVIVDDQVSGTINRGISHIRYDLMADNYVAANPSLRGASLIGMHWNPEYHSGVASDYKLVRQNYYNDEIKYYPQDVATASGLPSVSRLILR